MWCKTTLQRGTKPEVDPTRRTKTRALSLSLFPCYLSPFPRLSTRSRLEPAHQALRVHSTMPKRGRDTASAVAHAGERKQQGATREVQPR